MNRTDQGMQDMREAQKAKATEEHGVIDDAIQDQGEGYTVFSIPVGVLYRPSESKLKNAKTKDYLGKAQLIAAADAKDAFTTFTGVTRLQQGLTPSGAPIIDGRPIPPLSRAVTAAARVETTPSSAPPKDELKPASNLQKSATIGPGDPTRKPGLSRNPSAGAGLGAGLTRNPTSAGALSRNTSASGSSAAPAPGPGPGPPLEWEKSGQGQGTEPWCQGRDRSESGARLTEFYDEYIGAYEEPVPPVPAPEGVAAWAAKTKGAPPPPSGPPSRSASVMGGRAAGGYESRPSYDDQRSRSGYDERSQRPSYDERPRPSYDERSRSGFDERSRSGYDERSRAPPSSYGGSVMGVRRKLSRRPTRQAYEEEEEGYVSGDYSDAPFELVKIRVKLHYKDDVRGMAISPEMRFEEFLEKVSTKFGRPFGTLGLKFKDEDGGRVSMRDDSDYDLAIETARESARGRPEGKLEIWCTDE
ncbi:hypothetical protein FRC07_011601 [Ceratobasidium sp. 392]|nr:hypothetical protein FRC07_011601 [Ceratobasidium sp. 392]